jgi:thioredoxin 1
MSIHCQPLARLTGYLLLLLCAGRSWPQNSSGAPFAPLEQWKSAVVAGDATLLQAMFSTVPAARVETVKGPSDVAAEAGFWTGLKAQKITLDVMQSATPQPGVQTVIFQAEVQSKGSKDPLYVSEAQAWQQQSGQWRLVAAKRTEIAHLKQPAENNKNIYPAGVDARAEIKEAEDRAAKEQKRVLLVFGANWCFDCHVLDLAFQRPDFLPVVSRYEVVHVDIGDDGKKNSDIAKQFDVPLEKGIPAVAVLDASGRLLVSQKNGEFENARAMTPEALLEFLNKWKTGAGLSQ